MTPDRSNDLIEEHRAALKKAKNELNHAIYLSECGANAGIRAIAERKSAWLSSVVYMAEKYMQKEGLLS